MWIANFNSLCEKTGQKWDDLIINFEWLFDTFEIVKSKMLSDVQITIFE